MTIYYDSISEALGLRPIKELVPEYEEEILIPEDAYIQMKGELNPFYGKTHTEETKEILRKLKLGKPLSKETLEKMSKSLKGRQRSDTHCKNLSNALTGLKKTKEHVENHRRSLIEGGKVSGKNNPRYGAIVTEETRCKIAESLKGKMSGEKNPMYGKSVVSDKNLKWYNNGIKSFRFTEGKEPEGFVKGRLKQPRKEFMTA